MAELSLGILIDILDEEWMRDTLPHDGNSQSSFLYNQEINCNELYGLFNLVFLSLS